MTGEGCRYCPAPQHGTPHSTALQSTAWWHRSAPQQGSTADGKQPQPSPGNQGLPLLYCVVLHWAAQGSTVLCCAVLCGAEGAITLLPEGKGRDVYTRVQVNGRAVCVVCALCASVFAMAESGGMH